MNKQTTVTPRVIIQLIIFIIVVPLLPLLISRRWGWWEAWLYAAINIVGFAASRALAARAHPDLLAERARFLEHEDTAPWDKILAPLVGLGGGLIPLVAGLDARFGWSAGYSLPVELVALLFILFGFALGSYALIENRYFSGTVRIQAERNHHVVSTGPYAWMRHPATRARCSPIWRHPFFWRPTGRLRPCCLFRPCWLCALRWRIKRCKPGLTVIGRMLSGCAIGWCLGCGERRAKRAALRKRLG